MRVLLVEDDPSDALEMSRVLRRAAATVDVAGTGAAAIALAGRHHHDLVLLDLALPDMEGYEVLRRLRAARREAPVMMLPGHGPPAEKLHALGLGADASGLRACIQAATGAAPGASAPSLAAGLLMLNPVSRVATMKGRPLRLTGKEYDVLELLIQRRGAVLTKAAFVDHLYGGADGPATKIIDVFICKLRRKLDQAGAGLRIGTVRGHGYVLRAPETRPGAAAVPSIPM